MGGERIHSPAEERARQHRVMTEAALRECQKLCGQARLNAQHALDRTRRAEQARDVAEAENRKLRTALEEAEKLAEAGNRLQVVAQECHDKLSEATGSADGWLVIEQWWEAVARFRATLEATGE